LEKLYLAMKNKSPEITVAPELQAGALASIQRMLEMSAM
ncbi:MAG: quinolinate synthase NadA, partial [Cyanobacteria bacterium J06606_4]